MVSNEVKIRRFLELLGKIEDAYRASPHYQGGHVNIDGSATNFIAIEFKDECDPSRKFEAVSVGESFQFFQID